MKTSARSSTSSSAKLRHEHVPQVNSRKAGMRLYEQRWLKGFFYNPAATEQSYFTTATTWPAASSC
jgi:hypothetical protein